MILRIEAVYIVVLLMLYIMGVSHGPVVLRKHLLLLLLLVLLLTNTVGRCGSFLYKSEVLVVTVCTRSHESRNYCNHANANHGS